MKHSINRCIKEADVGSALDVAEKATSSDKNLNQQVILISSRYMELKKKERGGFISEERALIELNKIKHSLLEIAESVERKTPPKIGVKRILKFFYLI